MVDKAFGRRTRRTPAEMVRAGTDAILAELRRRIAGEDVRVKGCKFGVMRLTGRTE